jgi:hypothetical protein
MIDTSYIWVVRQGIMAETETRIETTTNDPNVPPTFKVEYMGIEGCMEGQSWLVSSETRDEQIWIYPDYGEFVGILYSSRHSDYGTGKFWRENFDVLVADLLRMGADITDFTLDKSEVA